MDRGDIVLSKMPVADYSFKLRPVLIINILPPYNDLFVCGISSQIHQHIKGLSFLINENDYFFESSGLNKSSVIRMNYLATIPVSWVFGKIGNVPGKVFEKILSDIVRLVQKNMIK